VSERDARAIKSVLDPGHVGRDHREHGGCVDTVNWNVMPGPSSRIAQIRPPWASMIEREIESPIPMPSGFVV